MSTGARRRGRGRADRGDPRQTQHRQPESSRYRFNHRRFLYPELRQIFFIGDGRISSGPFTGFIQQFTVPAGTRRLFLGTVDGEGWFNNSGQFTVETVVYPNEQAARCGNAADPPGISASDALAVLRAAVGSGSCSECFCDVDHSGGVVTNDALRVLRKAVGQEVALECPCCQFG